MPLDAKEFGATPLGDLLDNPLSTGTIWLSARQVVELF
jgi:hypothetical protein